MSIKNYHMRKKFTFSPTKIARTIAIFLFKKQWSFRLDSGLNIIFFSQCL